MNRAAQIELPGVPQRECEPPVYYLTAAQLRRGGWIILGDPDTTAEDIGRALGERERMTRPSRRGKDRA